MSQTNWAIDAAGAVDLAYGSPTLTITNPSGSPVAYKANNIAINRPTQEAKDYDTDGTPGRQRTTRDFAEMTGELQLALAATVLPVMGGTFTFSSDTVHGSENWYIVQADDVRTNAATDIRTVPFTAKLRENATLTVVLDS